LDIYRGFGFDEGADAPTASTPEAVWLGVARTVGLSGEQGATAARVAERINQAALPANGLYELLETLAGSAAGAQAGDNARNLSELVRAIEPVRLSGAIAASRNMSERKRLLQTMVGVLSVPAVFALLRAASHAYTKPFSQVMATLLNKSARLAQSAGPNSQADSAFRDLVRNIFEAWTTDLVDTTSIGFESFFASEETAAAVADVVVTPEPERILALAFETGEVGGPVWDAIGKLGQSDRGIRQIINMLKLAPENSKSAEMVAQQFATPDRLGALLREKSIDLDAVDVLLARMLESAGNTLMDALIDAPTPRLRRQLLQRMTALGPSIWEMAVERLKSETRPHALRDILASLRKTYCDVRNIPLERFVRHEDVRVRKEAMLILLDDPIERDRAVVAALRDPDLAVLKIGLRAARDGFPEAAVPMLAKRVVDPKFPVEFRTSVVQLLARSQSLLALEVLLGYAAGKTMLGKPTLAAKSPAMLIALSGLARMWPTERRAAEVLALARNSTDQEITDAVSASQARHVLPELEDPE
jgi:hypothetical protein